MGSNTQIVQILRFQKWRKELAKNREKLLGGSDKDKEKDKKATDKEKEKEEKKDKKEVQYSSLIRLLKYLYFKIHNFSLGLFICLLEKKEREEEIQQGEERPPVF